MKKMKIILIILSILLIILIIQLRPIYCQYFMGIESGYSQFLNYSDDYFEKGTQLFGLSFDITLLSSFLYMQLKIQHYAFNYMRIIPLSLDFREPKMSFTPLRLNIIMKLPSESSFKPYLLGGSGIIRERYISLYSKEAEIYKYHAIFSGGIGIEYLFKLKKINLGPYIETIYQFIFNNDLKGIFKNSGEFFFINIGVKLHIK